MPKMLTTEELAELLRLSKRQVAERVTKRKDFPRPFQIGGARRWYEHEVMQWLEERRV